MSAAAAVESRPVRSLRRRLLAWALCFLLSSPVVIGLIIWAGGPSLVAPVEDFPQGPGGAVAYISLYQQLQEQVPEFYAGEDIRLTLTADELSGMVSSALLSGRTQEAPVRKVRAGLEDGHIQVETVLRLPWPQVPERYQGPIGLNLSLHPIVTKQGRIRFRITSAQVGRVPIPPKLIQLGGRLYKVNVPGFDTEGPSIALPLGDMVESVLGRRVTIRQMEATAERVTLILASPPPEKN